MPKSTLSEFLINVFVEFVGLNKNPDFKQNKQSRQFVARAVREERRRNKAQLLRNPEVHT